MRALCIAGGGQAGSVTAGALYRLKRFYHLIVGTSTGAGIMTVANHHERLRTAYTTSTNKDIWKIRGVNKNDGPRWSVMLSRLIAGSSSWGDSSNLAQTIKGFYGPETHGGFIRGKVELVACVWDHTEQRIKYFSNLEHRWYPHFIKYVEASMSAPPAMNMVQDPVTKNWLEDGGVAEILPLTKTVELAAQRKILDVDAFVHQSRESLFGDIHKNKPHNHVHRLMRSLKARGKIILKDDILMGLKCAEDLGVNVHLHYLPVDNIKPRFYFDPSLQRKWFNLDPVDPQSHINHVQL